VPSEEGSVSRWLGQLREGDAAAVQKLWERYFPQLVSLARLKIRASARRAADEEDVALSAFDSFCRNAEQGRFPELASRDSLWQLLVVITARKAAHLVRDENRQKRKGAPAQPGEAMAVSVAEIVSREPSPEFAAQAAEECARLLRSLNDPVLEKVALSKMEGHTVAEIAANLGFAPRSIKRKLQLIRETWEREIAS
jgi:DNA-directed RNA polymerase specialized sigma24 family protein